MRTSHLNTFSTVAVAIALTLPSVANARSNSAREHRDQTAISQAEPDQIRRASKEDGNRTVDHLSGAELRDREGKTIGKIKDFIIDTNSGRVDYAVVSVGGFAGVGDKLHLVPYAMLQEQDGNHAFGASITKQELDQSPVLNDDDFEHDRVAVDEAEQQRILGAFPSTVPNAGAANGAGTNLVRATKLQGRNIEANGDKIGRVDGVVIERGSTHAVAMLKPRKGPDKVLVPLDRLKIDRNSKHAITTTLSPDQLGASSAPEPTGFSSAQQNGVDPLIASERTNVAAARSIRHALDEDSALAHANVDVTPDSKRVLVHGTVPSEDEKNAIMHAADSAAPNANIDFDISVKHR